MPTVYELNAGLLEPENGPKGQSGCRCLLFESEDGYALIDCGFGIRELQEPERYIGPGAASWHIVPNSDLSAFSQVRLLGLARADIRHIFCTHLDMDHVGGLVDFPDAAVHVSQPEYDSLVGGNSRYLKYQFEHGPRWVLHGGSLTQTTKGIGGWCLNDGAVRAWMVPLFGHTSGHCGVLFQFEGQTLLHCGDSYYRRTELAENHPADSGFPIRTANDNAGRLRTLDELALIQKSAPELLLFSTHDRDESSGMPHLLATAAFQS